MTTPARTNDLGQFRIPNLPPGTYYLGTMPRSSYVAGPAGGGAMMEDIVAFAPTYYPGTPDQTQAEPIVLKVGQQRLNVDLSMVAMRPARVSGTVLNSRGQPAPNVKVSSSQEIRGPGNMAAWSGPDGTTQADGRFTLTSVRPGEHILTADVTNPDTGERERAETTITVAGADLDNVILAAVSSVRATGRIRFDPDIDPGFASSRLSIYVGSLSSSLRLSSTIRPDWSFVVDGVTPGEARRLTVGGLPPAWTLQAVRYQGRDVTDTGLTIPAHQALAGLEITLTNRMTEVSGNVKDRDGQPVTDYTVLLFPEDSAKWTEESRWVTTARPDQNGRFTVRGLPGGKYFAVAVEFLEPGDSSDPEVLRALQSAAIKLALADGERKTVEVPLFKEDRR